MPPDDAPTSAGSTGVANGVGAWAVVVPVKRLAVAKSRLAAFGAAQREALALAFACDVVLEAVRCPEVVRVLAVTDDPVAAHALALLGALVVPDEPDAGLNAALAHGADLLRASLGPCGVATVSSDLPALRAADLSQVLQAVTLRGFVADTDARGTTLLAAAAGSALDPQFGPSSRARHLASGAVELPGTPALRQDVDTPEDLHRALRLGVGPQTRAACAGLR